MTDFALSISSQDPAVLLYFGYLSVPLKHKQDDKRLDVEILLLQIWSPSPGGRNSVWGCVAPSLAPRSIRVTYDVFLLEAS